MRRAGHDRRSIRRAIREQAEMLKAGGEAAAC